MLRQCLVLLLAAAAAWTSHAKCAYYESAPAHTSTDDAPAPTAQPYATPGPTLSFPAIGDQPQTNPCPMFQAGDEVCCNAYQLNMLYVNFLTLNSKFQTESVGGCPACAENLRTAWCLQTCSPHQDQLVTNAHITTLPLGMQGMMYDLRMNKAFACGTYDSCSAVTTSVQAGFNCEGLWNYQGQAETVQLVQHVYINFKYSDEEYPQAVSAPLQQCCNYNQTAFMPQRGPRAPADAGNTSCPCAMCKASCADGNCPVAPQKASSELTPSELSAPLYSSMYGFQWVPVVALYGAIAVATLLVQLWHCYGGRKQPAKAAAQAPSSYSLLH